MNSERFWVGLLWATVIMLPIALLLTVNLWVLFSSLAVAWLIGLAQTPGWKRWWGKRRPRRNRDD